MRDLLESNDLHLRERKFLQYEYRYLHIHLPALDRALATAGTSRAPAFRRPFARLPFRLVRARE